MERIEVRRVRSSSHPLRDDMGNIDELSNSIEQKGLLQPIIVRTANNGFFEVVAGNRRLEACRLLKWKKMPCYIVDFDDKEAFEVSLIENVQHKSLDYIEEARAFKKYVDENGYGAVSELARRIGKSPSYVSRKIAILDLPADIQEELLRRRKSSSIAEELASLDEESRKEVTESILGKNITRSEVRKIVKSIKEEKDEDYLCSHSLNDRRQRMIERTLTKFVTSLKVCMIRLDEALDNLDEDEWLSMEVLMQYRRFMHEHIDSILSLRKKIAKTPDLF